MLGFRSYFAAGLEGQSGHAVIGTRCQRNIEASWTSSSLAMKRNVLLLCYPDPVRQNCEFTCDGNSSFVLACFPPREASWQAPLSERRVLAVRTKDEVGTLDQETSQVAISCLGDAELRISIAGLTSFWS